MSRLDPGESRQWTYRGKRCKIHKHESGHWNGYVQTALRGFSQSALSDFEGENSVHLMSIHGGITYGPDEDGWVGFDTGHSRDLCLNEDGEPWGTMYVERGEEPLELRRHGSIEACEEAEDSFVWRLADVKGEVEKMADHLAALENFYTAVEDS